MLQTEIAISQRPVTLSCMVPGQLLFSRQAGSRPVLPRPSRDSITPVSTQPASITICKAHHYFVYISLICNASTLQVCKASNFNIAMKLGSKNISLPIGNIYCIASKFGGNYIWCRKYITSSMYVNTVRGSTLTEFVIQGLYWGYINGSIVAQISSPLDCAILSCTLAQSVL